MATEPATSDSMPDIPSTRDRNYGFMIGLIAGSLVGAGVGMFFAPRSVLDARKRAADSARSLGSAASDRIHKASTRVTDAVDTITKKGQGLRDDLSDAIVRGAQNVERLATDAKTGH